jgi:hypothetical protein
MKENETSVTFHIDKEVLKKFEKAVKFKEDELGIPLNRKQSLHLALKEITKAWSK